MMNKFKYIPIPRINNKATFSTSSKLHTDKDFYYERNKHITDSRDKVEAVSSSPVDKSLTSDKLLNQLEETKQQMDSNVSLVNDLASDANRLSNRVRVAYNTSKSQLEESQQDLVASNLGINSTYLDKDPESSSIEEKSLLDISRSQKKIADAIFKVKYLQENLPSGQDERSMNKRESQIRESEDMIKDFNSLSSNITSLLAKKSALKKELDTRDNTSHFVQDSSDVVQTDFSSFDPFEE